MEEKEIIEVEKGFEKAMKNIVRKELNRAKKQTEKIKKYKSKIIAQDIFIIVMFFASGYVFGHMRLF